MMYDTKKFVKKIKALIVCQFNGEEIVVSLKDLPMASVNWKDEEETMFF